MYPKEKEQQKGIQQMLQNYFALHVTSLPGLYGMSPKQHSNCNNGSKRLKIHNAVICHFYFLFFENMRK